MSDSTQGNVSPQDTQGSDAPKYVTEEQLNRAITARLTDFSKKQEKAIADSFGGFEKKLAEMLPPKVDPAQADPAKPANIQEHPEFRGLQKKLAELEQRARDAEMKSEAERQRGKDLTLRQRVSEELAKAGIKDATRLKHAIRFLADGEKLVKWNENGDALVFADSESGEVDFATGFKGWLKSDDAKLYLPSPEAPAGRQSPPQRFTPSGGQPTNIDELSFEDKLALTAMQLQKQGVGL